MGGDGTRPSTFFVLLYRSFFFVCVCAWCTCSHTTLHRVFRTLFLCVCVCCLCVSQKDTTVPVQSDPTFLFFLFWLACFSSFLFVSSLARSMLLWYVYWTLTRPPLDRLILSMIPSSGHERPKWLHLFSISRHHEKPWRFFGFVLFLFFFLS